MKWWAVAAGLAGAAMLAVAGYGAVTLTQGEGRLPWKMLRGASESMAPTIREGTRLTARHKAASDLRRGEIVVFMVGDNFWVQRVVGLPGDRVEMRGGTIVLNGTPVPQTDTGKFEIDGVTLAVRSERLPGATATHRVLDGGTTMGDDLPAVLVPPGMLFMLGDNRDNSMDSRFPAQPGIGGGLVAFADVYGTIAPEDIAD